MSTPIGSACSKNKLRGQKGFDHLVATTANTRRKPVKMAPSAGYQTQLPGHQATQGYSAIQGCGSGPTQPSCCPCCPCCPGGAQPVQCESAHVRTWRSMHTTVSTTTHALSKLHAHVRMHTGARSSEYKHFTCAARPEGGHTQPSTDTRGGPHRRPPVAKRIPAY